MVQPNTVRLETNPHTHYHLIIYISVGALNSTRSQEVGTGKTERRRWKDIRLVQKGMTTICVSIGVGPYDGKYRIGRRL